jgi:hypothetical protein
VVFYFTSLILIIFLFLPTSFMLPLFVILFFSYSLLSKKISYQVISLVIALVVTILNWSYMGLGMILWEWDNLLISTTVRLFSMLYIIAFVYINIFDKIKINISILILIFLTSISFLKSSDLFTGLKYLLNVYFPLIISFIFLLNLSNIKINPLLYKYNKLFFNIICLIIFVNIYFIILHIFSFINLNEFYFIVGNELRGGSEGNFRTIIFNMQIERFSGIFADPILAGYFFVSIFFYFLLFVKNQYLKFFLLLIIASLIALTISKASYLMLLLGFISYIIYKTKLRKSFKIFTIIILYGFTLLFAILRALKDGITDSSAIHVLGLTLPFANSLGLNYIFGHDLGSGGNMGGWVQQGAESFVGLLMYNTGLIGVFIYIYLIFHTVKYTVSVKSIVNFYVLIVWLPVMWASFLQENSFNMSFTIPRLILLIFIIVFSHKYINMNKSV